MFIVAVGVPGKVAEPLGVQPGTSTAPAGEVVSVHVKVIVPANPLVAVAVTAKLVGEPGLTAVGVDAVSVNPATAAVLTVTVTEVVDVALPALPVTRTV